ncbi:MAG: tRNA threonylcarbamoyladenosine biosynthesis protein TsaE, partial [uncultured Acetobacteraceae bacterium]
GGRLDHLAPGQLGGHRAPRRAPCLGPPAGRRAAAGRAARRRQERARPRRAAPLGGGPGAGGALALLHLGAVLRPAGRRRGAPLRPVSLVRPCRPRRTRLGRGAGGHCLGGMAGPPRRAAARRRHRPRPGARRRGGRTRSHPVRPAGAAAGFAGV